MLISFIQWFKCQLYPESNPIWDAVLIPEFGRLLKLVMMK